MITEEQELSCMVNMTVQFAHGAVCRRVSARHGKSSYNNAIYLFPRASG